MPLNDRDKLNRIEELKDKLFSKNYQVKSGHHDRFIDLKRNDVSDVWESDNNIPIDYSLNRGRLFLKTSLFKNLFIFSLVFFILTLSYAFFVFFAGGSRKKIKRLFQELLRWQVR